MTPLGGNVPSGTGLCKTGDVGLVGARATKTPVRKAADRRLRLMQTVFASGDEQAGCRCQRQQASEGDEDLADQ